MKWRCSACRKDDHSDAECWGPGTVRYFPPPAPLWQPSAVPPLLLLTAGQRASMQRELDARMRGRR